MSGVNTLSVPLMLVGFITGIMCSLGVLSGDDLGRVNILYLLIVFGLIPILGGLLSISSLISPRDLTFFQFISRLKIWPQSYQQTLHKVHQNHVAKDWFVMQSQSASLAYSFGCILSLFILLAISDVNFVWRSTLISAESLLTLLKIISTPWSFWDFAQPTQALVQSTQDNRLVNDYVNVNEYGKWWPFFFAMQLFYGFILRGALLVISRRILNAKLKKLATTSKTKIANKAQNKPTKTRASVTSTSSIDNGLLLANWGNFPNTTFNDLQCEISTSLSYEMLTDINTQESINRLRIHRVLVLVKAWEPPMGELSDLLIHSRGFVCPAELKDQALCAPSQKHLEEWHRFINEHEGWSLYQPPHWSAEGVNR